MQQYDDDRMEHVYIDQPNWQRQPAKPILRTYIDFMDSFKMQRATYTYIQISQ